MGELEKLKRLKEFIRAVNGKRLKVYGEVDKRRKAQGTRRKEKLKKLIEFIKFKEDGKR